MVWGSPIPMKAMDGRPLEEQLPRGTPTLGRAAGFPAPVHLQFLSGSGWHEFQGGIKARILLAICFLLDWLWLTIAGFLEVLQEALIQGRMSAPDSFFIVFEKCMTGKVTMSTHCPSLWCGVNHVHTVVSCSHFWSNEWEVLGQRWNFRIAPFCQRKTQPSLSWRCLVASFPMFLKHLIDMSFDCIKCFGQEPCNAIEVAVPEQLLDSEVGGGFANHPDSPHRGYVRGMQPLRVKHRTDCEYDYPGSQSPHGLAWPARAQDDWQRRVWEANFGNSCKEIFRAHRPSGQITTGLCRRGAGAE